MRGQIISRLITISLVSDNIYHGLAFIILLYNVIHPYVFFFVCRIMDGGCLKNAPFQPRHPSEY
jgi:hypothetical protein